MPQWHWIYQCCLPQPEKPCHSAASPSKTVNKRMRKTKRIKKNDILPMWCREVTIPAWDMVHSQNDITWQDNDNSASWHLPCVIYRLLKSSYWLTDCFLLCHHELALCGWQDVNIQLLTDCFLLCHLELALYGWQDVNNQLLLTDCFLLCHELTLCGWQDVRIQLLTN